MLKPSSNNNIPKVSLLQNISDIDNTHIYFHTHLFKHNQEKFEEKETKKLKTEQLPITKF